MNDERRITTEVRYYSLMYSGKRVSPKNVILVEGMHRAAALATWNPNTPFAGNVTIALAEWAEPIPTLGGNYKTR